MHIHNPLITTSINNISNRGDLAERTVILNLPHMPKSERKDDTEFWNAFNEDKSAIFTGILDGIVSGFKHIDSIQLESMPRMAKAAKWITACEQDFGMDGDFMKALTTNQDMACLDGIDASPAGMALKLFMEKRERYTGPVTKLLRELERFVDFRQTQLSTWPTTPNALTAILYDLNNSFESIGIDIGRKDNGNRNYIITNRHYKQQSLFGSGAMFSSVSDSSVKNTQNLPDADEAMKKNPWIDKEEDTE